MGKEWLYWVGGGGGGKSSGRRGRVAGAMKEGATSTGCMCAVFQLFDFHHFQPSDLQSDDLCLEEKATTSKGIDAPRNSLELEEKSSINGASKSLAIKEEENLNFPVSIQIKTSLSHNNISSSPRVSTSGSKSRSDDICSINSPGTKTPNLVARLMGLDLLPECSSPSISSSTQMKSHLNRRKDTNRRFFDDDITHGVSARSLPETPRISSARRSDVEYQTHRLSLQINKENIDEQKIRLIKLQQDENRSPGHYAKQIAKQVKENVTRRVGLDITNREHIRRDENLLLQMSTKKNAKIMSRFDEENSTSSCSPRIRLLDTKSPRVSSASDKPLPEHKQKQQKESKKVGKSSKKLPTKASDYVVRKKKEEPFVRTNKVSLREKKCKRTSLSCDILHTSGPTLLQVKKDPSPPPTKLPQKQVSDALSSKRSTQLSSTPSHSYKHPYNIFTLPQNVPPDNTNGCATPLVGGATAEYGNYIQKILKSAGVNKTLSKWHSPLHPIDPSIFYQLEFFHPTTSTTSAALGSAGNSILNHRCNRKMVFELVDELLAEILRPHFDLRLIISADNHFPLVEELCKKIDGFPAAKCQVLEDIDSLIDRDFCKPRLFEEERERIVCEIEGEMVEWLVGETVAVMGGGTAEEETETDRWHVRRVSRDVMPVLG